MGWAGVGYVNSYKKKIQLHKEYRFSTKNIFAGKCFLYPKSISHKFNTRHTLFVPPFPLSKYIFQNSVTNKSNQFNKIKNRTNISLLFSPPPKQRTHIYISKTISIFQHHRINQKTKENINHLSINL